MTYSNSRLRPIIGVLCRDFFRYAVALANPGNAYMGICNRNEWVEVSPDGRGYRCAWAWTSDLHAPKYVQALGVHLMRRALADHPIDRKTDARTTTQPADIGFIIGHRGVNRLPHLVATLESIAAQQGVSVECVVVEQDTEARIAEYLPSWVRHVHTPPPTPDMPYCRSWAFNVGAKHVTSAVFVLHDNDMLVPADYAANILELVHNGYEVINLKRFIFYLTEQHTKGIFEGKARLTDSAPLSIVQNLEGGGSVAVTRDAYEQLGGLDESFIGWGGEDNEFWERAQTRNVWPYAWLPIVHLWHPSQPEKQLANPDGLRLYRELACKPVVERIAALRAIPQGLMSGPRRLVA